MSYYYYGEDPLKKAAKPNSASLGHSKEPNQPCRCCSHGSRKIPQQRVVSDDRSAKGSSSLASGRP